MQKIMKKGKVMLKERNEKFYYEKPSLFRKEDAIDYVKEFYKYNSSIAGINCLDAFLNSYLPGASKGFIYKMLRKKNITLNGKKAEGTEKLKLEDSIKIFFYTTFILFIFLIYIFFKRRYFIFHLFRRKIRIN